MKKIEIFLLSFVLGAVTLIGFWNIYVLSSFIYRAPSTINSQTVLSPNQSQIMIASVNTSKNDLATYLCVKLAIRNAKTKDLLFEVQSHASDRMTWNVYWLSDNSIILESTDIGNTCWKENDDQAWEEISCPE